MTLTGTTVSSGIQANAYSADPAVPNGVSVSAVDSNAVPSGSAAGSSDGISRTYAVSVVSGTPYVLDCTALVDIFGKALTVAHVVGIKIKNTSVLAAGTLTHGGGSNALYGTAPLPIEPLGVFLWDASLHGGTGAPVAGGSKNLQLTASTGTVTAEITLLTRSA